MYVDLKRNNKKRKAESINRCASLESYRQVVWGQNCWPEKPNAESERNHGEIQIMIFIFICKRFISFCIIIFFKLYS